MPDASEEGWDLFISHASEDKDEFVRPLASALERFGVRVWYDEYTLNLGDSLSRSIDKGLANSDYGVVILSPAFVEKRWPEYELRGLTARELVGKKIILPVWHNITHQAVLKFSPPLADKLAVRSDQLTSLEIATRIIEVVRPDIFTKIIRRIAHFRMLKSAEKVMRKPSELKDGPLRHETLPPDLVGRARLIRASLLSAYAHSMDFWLDGFKRDSHPSNEIAHWEHVASVFLEYIAMTPSLTEKQRKQAFTIVSSLWIGLPTSELDTIASGLPAGAVQTIVELYSYLEPIYDFREKRSSPSAMAKKDQSTRMSTTWNPFRWICRMT